MKPQRLALLLLMSVALAWNLVASEAAPAISAAEVLRKALEARGGESAALAIHSFHAKGRVTFVSATGPWYGPAKTVVWPLEVFARRPNQWRVETDLTSTPAGTFGFVPPRYYPNGFDGQSAWEALPGHAPEVLEGLLGRERREQADFFGWYDRLERWQSLTNLGQTLFEGVTCYELKLVRKSGAEERHYYDCSNYLLVGSVRSSVFGPSLERFVFGNYRECGGFRFPARITYRAEDERDQAHLNAVEEFSSFEVNSTEEAAFARPSHPNPLACPQPADFRAITDAEIKTMLRDWIDGENDRRGIVVGLVDERSQRVLSQGHRWDFKPGPGSVVLAKVLGQGRLAQGPTPDRDTPMGLASVTKVFTRLLLLDMVQRGEMGLDDRVQKYLPPSVRVPTRNGKEITLLHLATHTSGLPRWVQGPDDTLEHMYASLAQVQFNHDPGEVFDYSNIGMALLGHVITLKAGKDYETLVQERICHPIGMTHTQVRPNYGLWPGAGALNSTARDMLTLAAAYLGLAPTNLPPLLRHAYLNHGGNDSFTSSLVLDPVRRRGVVMLGYPSTLNGERMILNQLILGQSPQPAAALTTHYKQYDAYCGLYLMDNNSAWSLRRQGDRLLMQKLWQPRCQLFAVTDTTLVNRLWDLEVTCEPLKSGEAPRLTLQALDSDWKAQGARISGQSPVKGRPVRLAPQFAAACTGRYQAADGTCIVLRGDQTRFTVESNPQDKKGMELFTVVPVSEACFFSEHDEHLFTVQRDSNGQVAGLVEHFYESHKPFVRMGPVPPGLEKTVTDRIVGMWEGAVEINANQRLDVSLRVSKAGHRYRTTVSVRKKDLTNLPLEGPVFLDGSNLYLYGDSFGHVALFRGELNAEGTELSGIWKEGQGSYSMSLQRNAGKSAK